MLPTMDSRKLALRCRELADDKKAENLVVLEVSELSNVTDYFVIATGTSEPHLRAIVDEVETKIRQEFGMRPRAMDGSVHTNWIVLDYFDVIVHVMRPEARQHYDLESLWGDAPRLRANRLRASTAHPRAAARKRVPRKKAARAKTA